tara:strand:- start:3852 stop:4019 length:168 start_codon:yes stop_codon:yes gene_type:complete
MHERFINYFFVKIDKISGKIIIIDKKYPGLKSQYNKPIEKISIQNSFLFKILITI